MKFHIRSGLFALLFSSAVWAAPQLPNGAVALDAPDIPADFRLHVEFASDEGGQLKIGEKFALSLEGGTAFDLAVERPSDGPPLFRLWRDGVLVQDAKESPELTPSNLDEKSTAALIEEKIDLGDDFTALCTFTSNGAGTLFSKCARKGDWAPDSKALFIRDGHLVYDIGWLGEMNGGPKVNDGQPHTVALAVQKGSARLWVDGKLAAEKEDFTRPDVAEHALKIGRAAPDFSGDFTDGSIKLVKFWKRCLNKKEVASLFRNDAKEANTPDIVWNGGAPASRPVVVATGAKNQVITAWIQPLERTDHSQLVRNWNEDSLKEGAQIYTTLCTVCHGTREAPGSLPTALRFAEGPFKNGADPYSIYRTLTHGFGQMVPQNQYTTAQKYSVIHYLRETFLRPHNPTQYTELTKSYLASLPFGKVKAEAEIKDDRAPEYKRMEFGPVLFWTLEFAPESIAQKAIAVRVDEGPGGVTKGHAWMVYDHDTMSLAAATTGDFVDWKGIAFDGSHGTHTRLTGTPHIVNPVGPGWADAAGKWEHPRTPGRDEKSYGPLPRDWAAYQGLYLHGNKAVLSFLIHGTSVLESPGFLDYGTTPVFFRTLQIGKSAQPLVLRVAPESNSVTLIGPGKLTKQDGFWIAELPGDSKVHLAISKLEQANLDVLAKNYQGTTDLASLTQGGPPRWQEKIATSFQPGPAGALSADTLELPVQNPWQSWMRPGGFDFTPDGKSAIVSTWNGDVWKVDGITEAADGFLTWRRIAAGLFQPLGVKFRQGELFLTCRDQLMRLKDLNGDGEADFYECFNNDHQVTEHFHEFAMGLQTDAAGNFYYAKSARHALTAVVPHHGTLLRVSADGKNTDILATGFRAANGVCLNPDGTFFVTDQEGHWTPKNRINRVRPGGFYGNLFGYTDVTDTSDEAMQEPLVWITNAMDRSPAELLWVPEKTWGPLGGALLNLSYGTGKIFIVPHEEVAGVWQGAVCELPMPAFPSGIMRGRFAADGTLFACGMFAWAGNALAPGGFHRIPPPTGPLHVPLKVQAKTGKLIVTLSDPIIAAAPEKIAATLKTWGLNRSANYGSKHVDEKELTIKSIQVSDDRKTLELTIPDLAPVRCYALTITLPSGDEASISRFIHGTIHKLAAP